MLDSHCHLDRYSDPHAIASEAGRRSVFVVAITNLPSHFRVALPHARRLPNVRLALGLHPLAAAHHQRELPAFRELFSETSFVGEVGLDLSREGRTSAARQVQTFREILRLLAGSRKFVSVHSRGAEDEVAHLLHEFGITGAVFHWYTGSARTLQRILGDGHLFSANPAMLRSGNGRKILRLIPRDRALTESDGPYAKLGRRGANPWDVQLAERYFAAEWGTTPAEARRQIWENFQRVLRRTNGGQTGQALR